MAHECITMKALHNSFMQFLEDKRLDKGVIINHVIYKRPIL